MFCRQIGDQLPVLLDQGINSDNLSFDQRGAGFSRTVDKLNIANASGGDGTDIGAVELS